MAQGLRTLITLPKGSVCSTHMVTHNHLYWYQVPSSGVSEDRLHIYIKINKFKN